MSSDKINLEEILKRFSHVDHGAVEDFWFTENVIKAMKEACRQTLELAAENAEICTDTMCSPYREDWVKYVDKQSILDTIKQVE